MRVKRVHLVLRALLWNLELRQSENDLSFKLRMDAQLYYFSVQKEIRILPVLLELPSRLEREC